MSLVYFDAPIKMSCIIPCLCIMPCYWLSVSLRCLFASSRIDDDVETYEVHDTTSEELAQYQATEFAGKYSLTWTIVSVPHLIPILPLSNLLALWFVACVPILSHVILKPWYSLTSTPITLLLVGLCLTSMLSVVCARVRCPLSFYHVYYVVRARY